MLKTASIQFRNSKYNYITSVNGKLTNEEIKVYFEGTTFNLGAYPKEDMQTCTKCDII